MLRYQYLTQIWVKQTNKNPNSKQGACLSSVQKAEGRGRQTWDSPLQINLVKQPLCVANFMPLWHKLWSFWKTDPQWRKMIPEDWPVGHFLGWWGMRENPAHWGQCHLWDDGPGCYLQKAKGASHREQASKRFCMASASVCDSRLLPRLLSWRTVMWKYKVLNKPFPPQVAFVAAFMMERKP